MKQCMVRGINHVDYTSIINRMTKSMVFENNHKLYKLSHESCRDQHVKRKQMIIDKDKGEDIVINNNGDR